MGRSHRLIGGRPMTYRVEIFVDDIHTEMYVHATSGEEACDLIAARLREMYGEAWCYVGLAGISPLCL